MGNKIKKKMSEEEKYTFTYCYKITPTHEPKPMREVHALELMRYFKERRLKLSK